MSSIFFACIFLLNCFDLILFHFEDVFDLISSFFALLFNRPSIFDKKGINFSFTLSVLSGQIFYLFDF